MVKGDWNRRKKTCPRGHLLEGDNLLTADVKRGKRSCRTCHNERRRK